MQRKNMLLTLAAAAASLPAFAQFSSPMRDVENPARYAFRRFCSANWLANESGNKACSFGTAPAVATGKLIVVASVVGICTSDDVGSRFRMPRLVYNQPGSAYIASYIPISSTAIAGGAVEQQVTGINLQIVADPTPGVTTITAVVSRSALGGTDSANCSLYLNGYWVP